MTAAAILFTCVKFGVVALGILQRPPVRDSVFRDAIPLGRDWGVGLGGRFGATKLREVISKTKERCVEGVPGKGRKSRLRRKGKTRVAKRLKERLLARKRKRKSGESAW